MATCAGAEVHDPVGALDRVPIVLDDNDRVPLVAEVLEGRDQLGGVAGVEADRGLVEHVDDARELASDLARELDSLGLSAGEGGAWPAQREILEPDVLEELEPSADLLEEFARDLLVGAREVPPEHVHPARCVRHRPPADRADRLAADEDRHALGSQTRSVAARARAIGVELGVVALALFALGLEQAALHLREDPLPAGVVDPASLPADLESLAAGETGHDHFALGLGQVLPRRLEVELELLGQAAHDASRPATSLRDRVLGPHDHRAFDHGLARVGDDQAPVHVEGVSEAVALAAEALGGVEREGLGRQVRE